MEIFGSKWFKIDFHMHTQASSDYRDSNIYTDDIWLLECMSKKLDCVVVSDHNSGLQIDSLKSSYLNLKQQNYSGFRELVIFPAIELTVNGGIHILVIFNEATSSTNLTQFIGSVNLNGSVGDINAITSKSLTEIIDIALKYNAIIIPAHVEQPKGIFNELTGQTLLDIIKNSNIFALEVTDNSYVFPTSYTQAGITHHRIVGSDSHQLCDIGRKFTWVKMGLPTFDGLKVALTDKLNKNIICSDELLTNPNEITWPYLSCLNIRNGYKIGRGTQLEMNFSPWLNTVIGGRGSGKSTIIKMIQYVFGKHEKLDASHPDKQNFYKPGSRNSSGMLTENIVIDLKYNEHNSINTFRKTITDYFKEDNNSFTPIEYQTIQELYPITIITQKELFEKALKPEQMLDLIDKKIDYRSWEQDFQHIIRLYEESKAQERLLENELSEKGKTLEMIAKNSQKLKTYEKYNYEILLNNLNKYRSENTKVNAVVEKIGKLQEILQNINIPDILNDIDFLGSDTPNITDISTILTSVESNISLQIQTLAKLNVTWQQLWEDSRWTQNLNVVNQEFEALKLELSNQGADISDFNTALQQKEDLEQKLLLITQKEAQLSQQRINSSTLLTSVHQKRHELYERRENYLNHVNEKLRTTFQDTRVRFSIEFLGDIVGSENSFRDMIGRTDNTFSNKILEIDNNDVTQSIGFLWELQNNDDKARALDSLKANISVATSQENLNFGSRLGGHFESYFQQQQSNQDKLWTWFPKDKLSIEIVLNGRNLEVTSASPGQRAAALITYILLETEGPLIIDQPEDDLDSRMITSLIVDSLRNIKNRRQVIVVTHNPNIPVNAAAEKIFEMSFAGGQIIIGSEGTIQEKIIRDTICDVMEGGVDALTHRFEKIINI